MRSKNTWEAGKVFFGFFPVGWKKFVFLHPRLKKCGNSSVGRARPCQGRGRGFESRFPLRKGPEAESGYSAFLFGHTYRIRSLCPDGGTGRRAGLKIQWTFCPWGFKSPSGYMKQSESESESERGSERGGDHSRFVSSLSLSNSLSKSHFFTNLALSR